MEGFGRMSYADGSSYEGYWRNNLMHGDGVYIDADKINWQGIFVEGQYDSKIQKKLLAEKVVKDKVAEFERKAKTIVEEFGEAFAKSDKKTVKDNLGPCLATTENCVDYVNVEAFAKFEDKKPEDWDKMLKETVAEDTTSIWHAYVAKDDGKNLTQEQVLVD